ncbi:MBL fold metallo-hydrolase [Aerococcaceae bacterium zg-ZJ1578]|nr:MBL fold metallo-hydrolase [Aerococcaceae bacterium zg-1578]MBR7927904.1 MBL fold metallo-hydrolase [Aerococcaceae bacterium zg-ZUI334]MBS4462370.1 MBL fold metallo-hydrolase [Aerococcaceae bacterium zg-B36]NEW64882.1 MBL fold metallo-hydrolase [Facklamia sp. 252]NEW68204.1 MBL fold metallo-hydrolase [Facklamia sp. 253]QQD66481.1 MBL fold metallo-hydrolase [Aerococcaceae bacterium zg-252]
MDKLRFSVLASGSSGNCTYVETDKQRVLIDAGLSGKKIQSLMEQINRDLTQVDALFVTHEHKDHILGVGVLARKYNLPVYANRMTWLAMENHIGAIPMENRRYIEPDQLLTLGDLDILSYNVSHDAAQPQFYAFQKGDKQFVMLTDTGYVSDRLRSQLKNATAYLIESNHEVEMLRYGQYPWSLKQRILGDKGHLSNEAGALAMVDMIGNQTKQIYLGHLSQDNNTKELAMSTMHSTLTAREMGVGEAFHLHMTDPSVATPMMYL